MNVMFPCMLGTYILKQNHLSLDKEKAIINSVCFLPRLIADHLLYRKVYCIIHNVH